MSMPLCCIGDAVLEVIGLNPQHFSSRSKANWPSQEVFDDEPFVQPTGLGARTVTVRLAARPHVMGGLDQVAVLRRHHQAQDVVPFIRLSGLASSALLPAGDVIADVGIEDISAEESRPAPDGIGYRWEFEVQLIVVGRNAGFGFDG